MSQKKRFAAVGTGGRIAMFIDPIARTYGDACELVAFCDLSQIRMDYHRGRLAKSFGYRGKIKTYAPDDFERMIDETRPDVVVVCTKDSLHHEYIVRALRKGCEVICEKPITVDDEKCRAIQQAVEATGGKVRVTFNVRWMPGPTKVKELIGQGVIGSVKHVALEYMLNTEHGADYFRRWHSEKASSGGLLVHKSTHHFDLVNWWLDGIPQTVYAMGDLVFYGKKNAIARGQEELTRYERYLGSNNPEDPFFFDVTAGSANEVYRKAEADSGYVRDRNVFRDGIDIEDSMSVLVRYRDGVMFNYSLNAFCPIEGFRASLSGDKGRIDFEHFTGSHLITGQSDEQLAKEQGSAFTRLIVRPLFGKAYEVEVPEGVGGHGGGDVLLQEQMFSPNPSEDSLGRSAGHEQGAVSALIGIAANQSIASGKPVRIDDLLCIKPGAVRLHELI